MPGFRCRRRHATLAERTQRRAPRGVAVGTRDVAADAWSASADLARAIPRAGRHRVSFWAAWCEPCVEQASAPRISKFLPPAARRAVATACPMSPLRYVIPGVGDSGGLSVRTDIGPEKEVGQRATCAPLDNVPGGGDEAVKGHRPVHDDLAVSRTRIAHLPHPRQRTRNTEPSMRCEAAPAISMRSKAATHRPARCTAPSSSASIAALCAGHWQGTSA
jgi:hypothetical protein